MNEVNFGDVLVCSETGKQFIAARDVVRSRIARYVYHRAMWYGRGSPGMCITVRAYKGKQ